MTDLLSVLTSILVMSAVTYACRALTMLIFRKKFRSRFLKSFLYYTPYAVLAALIIPAVFTSCSSVLSSVIGFAVALGLSLLNQKLIVVFAGSVAAVFLVEWLTTVL